MNWFRRWLKKWDWYFIGTWTIVIGLCLAFWYCVLRVFGVL